MRVASPMLLLVALAACTREDVQLLGELPVEAGADAGGADAQTDASACAPPSATCRRESSVCAADQDCCSGFCVNRRCVQSASCLVAGTDCSAREQCCSGRCEPVAESGRRTCTPFCAPSGALCARASDCCGFNCHGGRCGGAPCAMRNAACSVDADCCSNRCDTREGRCADVSDAVCRATLENCTSGGGTPCCAGCDEEREACDLGPGPCRGRGEPCRTATDCCSAQCSRAASGGLECGGGCAAEGQACQRSSDCCTGSCTGKSGVCTPESAACVTLGAACASDAQCCSGVCDADTCVSASCGP